MIKTKKEQEEIIDIIIEYDRKHPGNYEWKRTKESLIDEWRAHNDIYYVHKNDRCLHVDFDNADEGVTYFGFWKRAFDETIKLFGP